MKNLLFALFAVLAISFVSCGDDTEPCADDFAGTYTGTLVCDSTSTEDVEVTITGTDGNYKLDAAEFAGGNLDQDGCTLSYDVSLLGVGEFGTLTISGNTLTIVRSSGTSSVSVDCTYTGTK